MVGQSRRRPAAQRVGPLWMDTLGALHGSEAAFATQVARSKHVETVLRNEREVHPRRSTTPSAVNTDMGISTFKVISIYTVYIYIHTYVTLKGVVSGSPIPCEGSASKLPY